MLTVQINLLWMPMVEYICTFSTFVIEVVCGNLESLLCVTTPNKLQCK